MHVLLKKVVPICLVLVLGIGCNASRHGRSQTELAIPLDKLAPPEFIISVKLADYSMDSPFTKVVHIVRLPDGQFLALSAKDPNGGCTVPWNKLVQVFWNPCHGAKYNPRGEVLEGPAIRGLDRFPVRVSVENGQIYVDLANPPAPGAAK